MSACATAGAACRRTFCSTLSSVRKSPSPASSACRRIFTATVAPCHRACTGEPCSLVHANLTEVSKVARCMQVQMGSLASSPVVRTEPRCRHPDCRPIGCPSSSACCCTPCARRRTRPGPLWRRSPAWRGRPPSPAAARRCHMTSPSYQHTCMRAVAVDHVSSARGTIVAGRLQLVLPCTALHAATLQLRRAR
jgi:hypothetical protein